MKRRLLCIVLALTMLFTCFHAYGEEDAGLRIHIMQAPLIGDASHGLKGQVFVDGAKQADLREYFVACYIFVGQYWIKGFSSAESKDNIAYYRYPALPASGLFTINMPEENDKTATKICLMILPVSQNGSLTMNGYQEAKAHALDVVEIERSGNTLTFNYSDGRPSATFAPEGVYTAEQIADVPEPDAPAKIYLSYVPEYGVNDVVEGVVRGEDGFKSSDYRIALGFRMNGGSEIYYKPNETMPCMEPEANGSFSYKFCFEPNDIYATSIYLYLVPNSYINRFIRQGSFKGFDPGSVAVDTVTIERSPGSLSISPERSAPERHDLRSNVSVSGHKICVDIGFYIKKGQVPDAEISEAQMNEILDAVLPFANTVRFYRASGTINKAYALAKSKGLRVVGTAFVGQGEKNDKREKDALISLCKQGLVSIAIVGNETQLPGSKNRLTEAGLLADIEYVRRGIEGTGIPVTTSDSVDILIDQPRIREAVDILMPNIYPYWGSCRDGDAGVSSFRETMNRLIQKSAGKQIVISETMHPTADNEGDMSEAAAVYFEGVRSWSLATGIPVFFFEAVDEPWKRGSEGRGCEDHWGFMNNDLTIKECYLDTDFFSMIYADEDIVFLPDGTKELGDGAFVNCTEIKTVYIPASVETITGDPFDGCGDITIIAPEGSVAHGFALEHGYAWQKP